MLEFESKRKFRKRLYSKFTLVLLVIILGFVFNGTYKIFKKHLIVQQDLNASIANLESHENRRDDLERDMERINSSVGKEEILRDNYSLAKEGEEAVFLIDSDEKKEEPTEEKTLFDEIKGVIGNITGLFN